MDHAHAHAWAILVNKNMLCIRLKHNKSQSQR